MQEKAKKKNNDNKTICKIMYFINFIIGDTNHELAFVLCNFVLLSNQLNRIFSVAQMSAPLIHATDNSKLWIL